MAFGDNSNLDTTTTVTEVQNNNTNDVIDLGGNAQADAVWFTNAGTGKAGDKSIEDFGKNDSILNYKKIFDGNGDGIIAFGPNGVLDIDRTSSKKAGADQITLIGFTENAIRYLGTKGGDASTVDGAHVYAIASVRLAGFTEGTVGNDSFTATGAQNYFYDTALGLNLGGDTITGFGADDRIVTTTKIHNGVDAGAVITFGLNKILDLPGDVDGIKGDVGPLQGGQIEFIAPNIDKLSLLEVTNVDGVDYYYYGLALVEA